MAEGSSLLKNGNKVLIDSQPYLIIDNEFVNPGKGQAFTRIKIKNLLNSCLLVTPTQHPPRAGAADFRP